MSRPIVAAGVCSIVLHAAALWSLLPHARHRPGLDAPPTIEIELIDQAEQHQAPDLALNPVPDPAPPADPAPPPEPPRPAAPPGPGLQATPAAPPPTTVNLAGAEDQVPLKVSGPDVVPPRPDAVIRNRPPAYPIDAARRRAEGVVGLRIHVTAAGLPAWVDVARSSGDPSLDRAARDAVALWRFQPARNNGAPVPFDFDYNVKFTLGATP